MIRSVPANSLEMSDNEKVTLENEGTRLVPLCNSVESGFLCPPWLWVAPPHPGYAMNSTIINECAKTVPDSTKLRLIKGPKSKFLGGVCPQTPLV